MRAAAADRQTRLLQRFGPSVWPSTFQRPIGDMLTGPQRADGSRVLVEPLAAFVHRHVAMS